MAHSEILNPHKGDIMNNANPQAIVNHHQQIASKALTTQFVTVYASIAALVVADIALKVIAVLN